MTTRTPEGKVKDKVVLVLKQYRVWYCFPATFGRGRSGIPDILICCGGWFIGIECKAPGGVPTAAQDAELRNIRHNEGIGIVIDGSPDQLRALHDLLQKVTNRKIEREWPTTPRKEMEHGALRVALRVVLHRIRQLTSLVQKLLDQIPHVGPEIQAEADSLLLNEEIIIQATELLAASDPEAQG